MNQIQGQNVAVISLVLTWPFLLVLFYRLSILAIAVDVFQAWLMLTSHVSELLCPWSTHPWEHFCKDLAFHLRILPRTHPIPQKGFFRSYDYELFSQGKRNGSHPSWHCTKGRDTVLSSTKLTWVYYLKNVMQHNCDIFFYSSLETGLLVSLGKHKISWPFTGHITGAWTCWPFRGSCAAL